MTSAACTAVLGIVCRRLMAPGARRAEPAAVHVLVAVRAARRRLLELERQAREVHPPLSAASCRTIPPVQNMHTPASVPA